MNPEDKKLELKAQTEAEARLATEISTRGVAANPSWNIPMADALRVVRVLKDFQYPVKRLFVPSQPVAAPHTTVLYTKEQVSAAGLAYMPLAWTIQFEGSDGIENWHSVAHMHRAINGDAITGLRQVYDSIAPALPALPSFEAYILASPKVFAAVQQIIREASGVYA